MIFNFIGDQPKDCSKEYEKFLKKLEQENEKFPEHRSLEICFPGGYYELKLSEDLSDEYVESMVKRFVELFYISPPFDVEEYEFVWCLVGNIINKHYFGENKEIRRGTKQFRPGAKVYCFPSQWCDGLGNVVVLGKPRKRKKMIKVVTQSDYIKNWRMEKVYDPYIISRMLSEFGWTNSNKDKERIEEMIIGLRKRPGIEIIE